MKLVLLLGIFLLGAYAQTVPTWDLSEISEDVELPRQSEANQGYTARYTNSGKSLKLSLTVHKEKAPRVTDSDRLLFGMEGAPPALEAAMANITVDRKDTEAIVKSSLGSDWATMVRLPTEDLSYVETLRLATSLNEYNLRAGGNTRKGRGSPAGYDCICHGTTHHFPAPHGVEAPYWGVRVLQRQTRYTNPGHAPYGNRDCILCDHNEIAQADTESGFEYDCRWCCSGDCIVGTGNESENPNYPGWDNCDKTFMYDQIRADPSDPSFNYYLLNDVGSCRLPRVYHCEDEVERYCETCEPFLDVLVANAEADSDDFAAFKQCKFCDLVVGANPYICKNCSDTMWAIERFGDLGSGFRGESTCSCDYAMWQIANSPAQKHRNPALYWLPPTHESHEGDHYESHESHAPAYDYDYDYRAPAYDYDYRAPAYDYDYRPADYDYRPAYDYDYRPADYDYRPAYDYDYRPADYDYRPAYDYDYRPADYDYRPAYDYDYRPADYDYRPAYDYDYRPADYDYRPAYDYDYRPADYDYRPAYDYDYRPADYDYRPAYDYDYRAPAYDYDYRPAYDYAPADYDYRPAYDYAPADYDYRPAYDYAPADYDYRPAYDYAPADYDYRPAYDYAPADYDYRPAYDYRPVDYRPQGQYDYAPADYDYRPQYDYDYRPADYDYRPVDYDYRPADYDYEGDHYEAHHESSYDYDYAPPTYDYTYSRPSYDYDYRPVDYDYRPAYDYRG